jgi:hypothetical protein
MDRRWETCILAREVIYWLYQDDWGSFGGWCVCYFLMEFHSCSHASHVWCLMLEPQASGMLAFYSPCAGTVLALSFALLFQETDQLEMFLSALRMSDSCSVINYLLVKVLG